MVGDIPAADDNCHGDEITDRADRAKGVDRDVHAELLLEGWGRKPLPAGQVVAGEVRFTGPDGKPFMSLEPVMGAFAHLVGFSDDGKTVLHIHPQGEEPTSADQRGGPSLKFNFYAPTPGYYRLYIQVAVGGENRFIPVGVNVRSADRPATQPSP